MTAYQQLRTAYLNSHLTVAEIAAIAGYSENTVCRAIGPHPRNVSADAFLAIAGALQLQVITVWTPTSRVA